MVNKCDGGSDNSEQEEEHEHDGKAGGMGCGDTALIAMTIIR